MAWTEVDMNRAGIYWAHKDHRSLIGSVVQAGTTQAFDVVVYDQSVQPSVETLDDSGTNYKCFSISL